MRKYFIIIGLLFSLTLKAQNPLVTQQQKMTPMQSLAGKWAGQGWILLPDGQKHTFNQTELVSAKMDGGLLTIEGNGKDTQTGRPIHNAFAILTYDNGKQAYRWTAVSSGYLTDVVPEINPGSLIWSLATRNGTIRYTLTFGTEWVEKGELSTDNGQTWSQNFEMHLKKVE